MNKKFVSSLLFMIPAILAFSEDLHLYGAVILMGMAASWLYHQNGEKKFGDLHTALSILLMLINLCFLYLSKSFFPYALFASSLLALSVWVWWRGSCTGHDFYHSVWHMMSMLITLCCLFAYTKNY